MKQTDLAGSAACLIVDSDKIAKWQFEALKLAMQRGLSVSCVYVCGNTIVPRKYLKHAGYYALNLLSMRHSWTKGFLERSNKTRDTCSPLQLRLGGGLAARKQRNPA